MAVRSKNAHWKVQGILHRLALGIRRDIVTEDGQQAQFLLDDLVARTPGVVAPVREKLPDSFPEQMAESILNGLQDVADRLSE